MYYGYYMTLISISTFAEFIHQGDITLFFLINDLNVQHIFVLIKFELYRTGLKLIYLLLLKSLVWGTTHVLY